MEILYSTTTAARMLGMNPSRLKRWVDFGYYSPDAEAVLGETSEVLAKCFENASQHNQLQGVLNAFF